MKRSLIFTISICCLAALATAITGCDSDNKYGYPQLPERMITNLYIKPSMAVYGGQTVLFLARGFEEGDYIVLTDSDGNSYELPAGDITGNHVSFTVPEGFRAGRYTLSARRQSVTQYLAEVAFRITRSFEVEQRSGYNVYGVVFCGTDPVAGVRVSDGVTTTVTDSEGRYWLDSDKYHGYVFMSFPSGYEPVCSVNAVPEFWTSLNLGPAYTERHDLELVKVDNRNHIVIVGADIHVAGRSTNDIAMFRSGFMAEAEQMVAANPGKRVYTLLVGDQTWERYWFTNNFQHRDFKALLTGYATPVFQLMGNHDNHPYLSGDFEGETTFKEVFGPTYFSMDIGDIHYILLDNNVWINDDAAEGVIGERNFSRYFTDIQLEWLREDLAAVADKGKPLMVAFHCQSHNNYNATFANTQNLSGGRTSAFVAMFDGFSDVHFLSGHSHINANMQISPTLMEHNTAAVCETYWWSEYLSGRNICKDGSPSGYGVYEFTGSDLEWYYKGIGTDRNYQFRTYDVNTVKEYFTSGVMEITAMYDGRDDGNDYGNVGRNGILINVWNWDPEWTVKVTELGHDLPVERVFLSDPLHTICYDVPRYRHDQTIVTDWGSGKNSHMFLAYASASNTTVRVEVTDRFGNVYTETMVRPKAYRIEME